MNINIDQNSIAAAGLYARLTEQPETALIDLLSQEHFARRHIPGARNSCVFQMSFLDDIAAIASDKQSPIVVYGASPNSQDAKTAIEKLNRSGYENITFLEGGLEAWQRAGYALEGDEPDRQDDPQTRLTLADGQYTVDADSSQVEWTGRNQNRNEAIFLDKCVAQLKKHSQMLEAYASINEVNEKEL